MNDFEVKTSGTLYVETPDGCEKLAEINDIQIVEDITPMPETFISGIAEPISFTCETQFDSDVASLLPPAEPQEPPMMMNCYKVQKRKHHKIRINKKWAKRYGYWLMEDVYEVEWIQQRNTLECEAKLTFKERRRYGEELHGVSSTFIL